jgi:branched-subunit amino acid aminotransferase/4-amino-4-deoxychorismate lyase
MLRIELNGQHVGAETLWRAASGFGHFTAMQIRNRRARGLVLHLARLEAANRELFGADLDQERVRWLIRHALRTVEDASVRIYIFESNADPISMVTVKEPGGIKSPQRLQSTRYQRPHAHLKHLATGQGYYSRLAHRNGFDDALLTAADGTVSETATANIGFFDQTGVVWPDGPMLHGITMQLLERALPPRGVSIRRAPITLEDALSFDCAFLSNARGLAAVTQVDNHRLAADAGSLETIADAYASIPWEAI